MTQASAPAQGSLHLPADDTQPLAVAIVGGGPAGLMAAEVLGAAGLQVDLYDAMPSVGRKFLLAGKGGLNITHSEPLDQFESRYGTRRDEIATRLRAFGPSDLRTWVASLGVQTFVGSSGRVFPSEMKAAPLLRAWLHRLRYPERGLAVRFHSRHHWIGWSDRIAGGNGGDGGDARTRLQFETPGGTQTVSADAVVLALGGASWPRLGSDGAWVEPLRVRGVDVADLVPANCGFDVQGRWSAHFADKFAGVPFKSVAIRVIGPDGEIFERKGEFVATASGVEGSLIYAASGLLRESIASTGQAVFTIDLLPALSAERVLAEVAHPRGSRSLSSHLKSRLGIEGIKAGLLHEVASRDDLADAARLSDLLKALPVTLSAARPVDEAISSAGGVRFEAMDANAMLRCLPGVFCAGEMLDWEAPTGGYLLTACMASGRAAAMGAMSWLHYDGANSPEPVEFEADDANTVPPVGRRSPRQP